MSLHPRDKVHVAVFNQAIWNAWNPWAAYEKFPDLCQGLEQEDFAQIKLLLFQTKEMDSNPNRKAFQQDTQAKATQAALIARPEEIMDLQRHIDEDTRDILHVAARRMEFLLKDKAHFLHKKEVLPENHTVPLIQQKKELLEQFLAQPSANAVTANSATTPSL